MRFTQVNTRAYLPLRSTTTVCLLIVPVSLIALGSGIIWSAVLSVSIPAILATYVLLIMLLLYRRTIAHIRSPRPKQANPMLLNTPDRQLAWGPWHIPGAWGILINTFACIYGTVIFIAGFFPSSVHVTADTIDWDVLTFPVVLILLLLYYFTRGRYAESPTTKKTSSNLGVEKTIKGPLSTYALNKIGTTTMENIYTCYLD